MMMRKLLFVSGFAWASTYLLSVLFRILAWPGHGALVMGQGFILGMVLLPVYLLYRMQTQSEMKLRDKVLYVVGGLASLLVTISTLFKTMHWPGANVLLVSSIWLLALGFVPLLLWNWYHQAAHPQQA